METLEAIKKRRSVRKYLKKQIPNNILVKILETATLAPSSGNLQNTRLILIKDKEKISKIASACLDQYWINTAPVVLAVCSDDQNIKRVYNKRADLYSIQNTAAAIENMLIAAASLNIGSCWIGAFNDLEIKKILKLPEHIKPHAIITFGYSDDKSLQPKKEPLRNLLFFEDYGKKTTDISFWPIIKHFKKR